MAESNSMFSSGTSVQHSAVQDVSSVSCKPGTLQLLFIIGSPKSGLYEILRISFSSGSRNGRFSWESVRDIGSVTVAGLPWVPADG